ncbi:MAG: ATP-dependent metallopeptidase FtsH/Yme1/Tma family protein [Methylotenera sp.]|nr:ATP-dependent metallopeptidase FtsH/Yme1/Tma family protein [Oligoflexia bacterium]
MKPSHKTVALWLVLILLFASLFKVFDPGNRHRREIKFSEFVGYVKEGKVDDVTFKADNLIVGTFKEAGADGKKNFETVGATDNPKVFEILEQNKIIPNYERAEKTPIWQQVLISWFPMLLLFVFFFLFMRQIQVGGGKAMSFGKSKARLLTESGTKITFKDVAGADESKQELEEIIAFLRDPKKFTRLGGRIPKGVLLMGPPGTGKTLLARAVAGEGGVPFFSISGSDFVEMFVGVGASRVRDLFEQGKKHAPCIIFIDEIDAVGRHRGAGLGGGHDEREQTLNQLLVEMDGFESNEGVILIAATNRPDVLDPALLRPGRFDRRVVVSIPDVKGREAILRVHTRKTPMAAGVDLSIIARGTPGFSGADLENLVNEAALLAAREDKKYLELSDFENAKDKVMMGVERKSMVLTEQEKRVTAYHEAGHTLVGKFLVGTDPIHKVTIIPRGMALGVTQTLPSEDRTNLSKDRAEDNIAFLMGGRVAEELVFHQKTTGAGNDIERATGLARRMVCEWGMSDVLGPLTFGQKEQEIFLGREISQHRDFSEQTAQTIDREVRDLVERNYRRAREILSTKLNILHELAKALLEYETLDGAEVERIVRGLKIERTPPETLSNLPPPTTPATVVAPVTGLTESGTGGGASPAPMPA